MELTYSAIKRKVKSLGVDVLAADPLIQELVRVSVMLDDMHDNIETDGYSVKQTSREGNSRIVAHPLLPEYIKLEGIKRDLMDRLLLSPRELHKLTLESKDKDNPFEDIPKPKKPKNETA